MRVIIPSRTVENVLPCVEAVRQNEQKIDITVVWDCHGSNGYTPAILHHESIISVYDPFIFARNINIGIRTSPLADGYVLLNDDALLKTPGGFSLLAQAAREHPEYGIIGAVTNVTGQPEQMPRGVGLRAVPHLAFVCVYIPRTTIDTVGLLDERYCLDYGVEDRDYCEAVTRAGLKVGVHDGCFVDHGSLRSSFRGDPAMPRSFTQNYALFQKKWGVL
jgi:GT2 family glycosyltransferase